MCAAIPAAFFNVPRKSLTIGPPQPLTSTGARLLQVITLFVTLFCCRRVTLAASEALLIFGLEPSSLGFADVHTVTITISTEGWPLSGLPMIITMNKALFNWSWTHNWSGQILTYVAQETGSVQIPVCSAMSSLRSSTHAYEFIPSYLIVLVANVYHFIFLNCILN